jgi:hypothetical protein
VYKAAAAAAAEEEEEEKTCLLGVVSEAQRYPPTRRSSAPCRHRPSEQASAGAGPGDAFLVVFGWRRNVWVKGVGDSSIVIIADLCRKETSESNVKTKTKKHWPTGFIFSVATVEMWYLDCRR